MLSAALNILTIFVVALLFMFVYYAYKSKSADDYASTPFDVFKSLVKYGPNMRESISELGVGDIGTFDPLSTLDDNWSS